MRNISIHDICSTLSSDKAKAPPALHTLTGSYNTSLFSGTGKKSAKWSTRPELTATLCHLMDKPETPSSDDITVIESFVISLYSITCTLTDANQARQQIFAQSSRSFKYIRRRKQPSPSGICMGPSHLRQASIAYPESLGLGQI